MRMAFARAHAVWVWRCVATADAAELPVLLRSEGGFFRAEMVFPKDYPNMPPTLKMVSDFWHPNVYPDGRVCISILHAPGDDAFGYESAAERWLPVHTVESILISVISMIASPNADSPANIEAAKELRDDPAAYRKKVQRCVRRSQEG